MRHKKRGRTLGRNSSHRRALLRNLASSLFLTEWDFEEEITHPYDDPPKHPGRITTTLHKAKEVRSMVEKCVTIAIKSLSSARDAEEFSSTADKQTDTAAWEAWRNSEEWQKWAEARAPAVTARRRVLRILGNKKAVKVLFDRIAPRFEDQGRTSGYTRVLRLANPRLGDGGIQAILEFTGEADRTREDPKQPLVSDDDQADEETLDDQLEDQDPEADLDDSTDTAEDQEADAEEETAETAGETDTEEDQDVTENVEATESASKENDPQDDKE